MTAPTTPAHDGTVTVVLAAHGEAETSSAGPGDWHA